MTENHTEELARVGLESIPLKPVAYPRIVQEGDQLWFRVQVDGRDRQCEVSVQGAFVMAMDLMRALAALCRR